MKFAMRASVASGVVLAFALTVAPPSASAQDDACLIQDVAVANAAKPVGVKLSVTRTVTVDLTNCTPAEADATTVRWWVNGIEGGSAPLATLEPTSSKNDVFRYKAAITDRPADLDNFLAGSYNTSIRTERAGVRAERSAPSIELLRASRFVKFNVSPEPVRKGKTLFIKGQLQRASWDTRKYVSHSAADATLQFRTTDGAYEDLETLFWGAAPGLGRAGGYYTEVKATKDGCFRLVYGGGRTTGAATSKPDCIDVR